MRNSTHRSVSLCCALCAEAASPSPAGQWQSKIGGLYFTRNKQNHQNIHQIAALRCRAIVDRPIRMLYVLCMDMCCCMPETNTTHKRQRAAKASAHGVHKIKYAKYNTNTQTPRLLHSSLPGKYTQSLYVYLHILYT